MAKDSIRPMIEVQRALAPEGIAIREIGSSIFARGLYRLSVDHGSDDQPYFSFEDGLLAVADARIDNRDELLDRLGLSRTATISDAELFFRTFRDVGEKSVELVIGDFAIAIWEEGRRRLTLARDFTGQRPLHFHVGQGFAAFSTMPHGLLAHEEISTEPDSRQWAEFFADIPRSGQRTYFRDLKRVEPGHVVYIDATGARTRPYWQPPAGRNEFSTDGQYRHALREQLERATRSRLRDVAKEVGAHLSGGLDSASVATTAALHMKERDGRVIAFTGAPRAGFEGPLPRGRIADESSIAAQAAALHPNIDHVVVRAEGISPLDIISRDSGLFGEPLGLPCNQTWWAAIVQAAQARGLRVLLTGEAGNYAFSSGGLPTLAEFVAHRQFGHLSREVWNLRRSGARWQGLAGSAFGPWFPKPIWAALQRWKWGRSTSHQGFALLQASARAELPRDSGSMSRSHRPARGRTAVAAMLQNLDPGVFRKATLAQWGVEERDPTTDRRLVEFCLTLPPEQLLRDGLTRALARTAFTDRLPGELLEGPRGYQGADWYERVDGDAVLQAIDVIADDLDGDAIVDLDAVRNVARNWPSTDWQSGSTISTYRYALLRAISAAYFLASFKRAANARPLHQSAALSKETS